ncbi:MAG: NAD(P)-dependent oxidoreductase [Devosia sp.]|nr:NAD(P)-dependent oxidoreductase [Devosia sp.]
MTVATGAPKTSLEAQSLTIAITGGAGKVATALRQVISARFRAVHIIDVVAPASLAANESFHAVDISRLDELAAAFSGVDGIIHLAGYPNDHDRSAEEMLQVNVLGSSHVYEAARRAGVGRVVLGSSNHTVGFYPRTQRIGSAVPMRPDGLYGLTKCWAELTAGLYYDKCGIRTLIVRIGNAQAEPTTPRSLEIWLSPGDLGRLVIIGMTHPEIDCTTVYGVSAGGGSWYDNTVAERLGFVPQDRIADFAHADAFRHQPGDLPEIADYFQGGPFCAQDHDGILRVRPLP